MSDLGSAMGESGGGGMLVPSVSEKLRGARVGSWNFPFMLFVSDGIEKVRGFVEPVVAVMMRLLAGWISIVSSPPLGYVGGERIRESGKWASGASFAGSFVNGPASVWGFRNPCRYRVEIRCGISHASEDRGGKRAHNVSNTAGPTMNDQQMQWR